MADPTVIAARRYSDLHPGYQLVHAGEAAIPVSMLTLDVLAQERKPLPLVDEFVLRLADQDVNKVASIAGLLGIDADTVQDAVAQQLSAETVDYRPDPLGGRKVLLTPAGKLAVTELATTRPQRIEQQQAFDRLLWKPTSHTKSELISRADADAQGMILLPSARTSEVATEDVTPRLLNLLLDQSERRGGERTIEVLSVERITRQPRLFLPGVLLIYATDTFDDVRFSVVVDDVASDPHDHALIQAGGLERLKIRVEAPNGEPELPPGLLAHRAPYKVVRSLQRRADNPPPPDDPTLIGEGGVEQDDSVTARAELDAMTVRSVPVFEHRELLARALDTAKSRFLLAAPWVRDAVVTDEFIRKVEMMLRRPDMTAHIVYGIGYSDRHNDRAALNRLQAIAQRNPKLQLVHLREPHPKILIFDDTWVNTSFDWLSFRGDPERTYRREEGTLVREKAVVDEQYARYIELMG